jgi:hypothetical protein
METDTRDGGTTIRKKARECIHGQTAADTKETGRMEIRKAREC